MITFLTLISENNKKNLNKNNKKNKKFCNWTYLKMNDKVLLLQFHH